VLAGIEMVNVTSKGAGPVLTDLMGGQISAFFAGVATIVNQIKAGRIRALGVTTLCRPAAIPYVPNIMESGVPSHKTDGWYSLLAPARTPAVIFRLTKELAASVAAGKRRSVFSPPESIRDH